MAALAEFVVITVVVKEGFTIAPRLVEERM
jgi:hypothetical protein